MHRHPASFDSLPFDRLRVAAQDEGGSFDGIKKTLHPEPARSAESKDALSPSSRDTLESVHRDLFGSLVP